MSMSYVLPFTDQTASLETVGGKGASLTRLSVAGLPVPEGFHVTTDAYRAFLSENRLEAGIQAALANLDGMQPDRLEAASLAIQALFDQAQVPPGVAEAITSAYTALPGANPATAVRSSATAEDLPWLSFAGQQETYLNVQGAGEVLCAVKNCWASLWTPRAIAYREQHGVDHTTVAMAVVVQVLFPAESAGVLFTADPVTGRRDRAVISAAWGLGEAVVGGLVDPDTLVVDKTSSQVLERQTADKQVMTVRLDGGVEQRAVPPDMRQAPVLDDRVAAELAGLGRQIEDLYGMSMDIEGARSGGRFAILQARPITALPEPEAGQPVNWPIPDPKGMFARGSLGEHLPNPVRPLFRTMGLRIANETTFELMQKIFPSGRLTNQYFAINGYVYGGGRYGLREMPEMITGALRSARWMFRTGLDRWLDARTKLSEAVEKWEAGRPVETLTPSELLAGAQEIFTRVMRYYNEIQAGILPVASSSEVIFTRFYNALVRRKGDPEASIFLFGLDTAPIRAEKSLFDLAAWSRERPALAGYMERSSASELAEALKQLEPPAGVPAEDWAGWSERFQAHLHEHGRSVFEFDFSNPVPAEAPEPMLETVKMYLAGRGTNPHERQQAAAERREAATQEILARLGWPRKGWFQGLLRWAQKYAAAREDSLAGLGMGHGQIRRLLGELARHFVRAGAIIEADDIYWLEEGEVEALIQALENGQPLPDLAASIPPRKAAWRAALRLTPPSVLPQTSAWARLVPWNTERQEDESILKGTGASAGVVTAPASVVIEPADFHKMKPGAVLVAVTTTPAWTPLFAMASAVVTDIGGPLSHTSIVAREYGIPAVMATGLATRRIQDGQMITVDGSAGTVKIH